MASQVRIRHGSSVDLASNQHAIAEVQRLLSRLDGASAAIRKITAKAAIREFANYYFDHMPSLASHSETVRSLLERLIASAGNVSWKQMRELKKSRIRNENYIFLICSSVHALELLGRLLDNETNQNAGEFRAALISIPVKSFRDMKLDKHLASSNSQPDVACLVTSLILELRSDIALDMIVESSAAQGTYYEWEDTQNQEARNDNSVSPEGGYFEVKTAVDPVKWNEVDVGELYRLVDSFNDPNEDSEESVKKSDDVGIIADESEVSDPLGITSIDSKRFQKSKTKSKFWAKRLRFVKKRSSEEDTPQDFDDVPEIGVEGGDDDENELVNDSRLALGSSSPYEKDFNPVLFLLDVHRATPFSQLEFGLTNLRKIVNNRQNLMRELVRDNFDEFVSCKDAIDSIQDLCSTEVKLSSSDKVYQSNTGAVLPLLKAVCQKMSQLYSPLFQRKDEAERIRHVLSILRRFNFLFSLPGVLQSNIKMQKYDAVVRDYRKLSQVQEIDVDLLEEIIAEIRLIIDRFRKSLLATLDSPNGNFPEQIRIIGILFDLESEEDPSCYFLNRQFEFICSEIYRTKSEFEKKYISERESFAIECIQFVDKMLRSRVSVLWKLATNLAVNHVNKNPDAGNSHKQVLNRFEEHFQPMSSKLCLFSSSLLFSGEKLHFGFVISATMISTLLYLLEYFNGMGIPQELTFEFHHLCRASCNQLVQDVFSNVACQIRIPIPDDFWQVDDKSDRQGVVVLFTYVRTLILQSLQSVGNFKEISSSCIEDNWISEHVGPPLLEIFCLVFDGVHEAIMNHNTAAKNKSDSSAEERKSAIKDTVEHANSDFRLILILHNLAYCRNNAIPSIWDAFLDLTPGVSSNSLDSKLQDIISLTLVLEQLAFDSFLKRQVLTLNEIINEGVLLSGQQWDHAAELHDVRGYAYEILIKLVLVHDQLSFVGASPDLAINVVSEILFHTLTVFQSTTSVIDKFNSAGCEQLLLEIEFVEASLGRSIPYRTEIGPLLREIKTRLLDGILDSKPGKRSELLQTARSSSVAMFGCFTGT